jgi:exportin-T
MRPYVEVVVEGIQNLLFPSEGVQVLPMPPNDALYLFETTGILLGTTGLDDNLQQRCATAVLTPHVQSIERVLQSVDLQRDAEVYAEQLSMSISAIAQLSKGWQSHPPPGVQTVLAAAVDISLKVLVALSTSPLIRNRMAVLLQRMILCLGEGILPKVPEFLHIILLNCTTEEDVLDTSQLINQLCIKFKEGAAPAIDSSILPFLQRVLARQLSESSVVSSDSVTPPPHLVTEQLSIRKQAFSTLQHVATHNSSAVFYSEKNVGSFQDILRLMNDGAIAVPDPVMKKTCIMFFGELTREWGSDGCTVQMSVRNCYFDFIYDVFIPGMLSCILDVSFNAKDAMHFRVLAEFSAVLWRVKQSHRGHAEFYSRVSKLIESVSFSGAGPPSSVSPTIIATGFQKAGSEKDMVLCLMAWKEGALQCTKID